VYSHRFDKANDATTTREVLSAGSLLSGNQMETARLVQTKNVKPKTAQLRAVGAGRSRPRRLQPVLQAGGHRFGPGTLRQE
jgi:hypothetical protein